MIPLHHRRPGLLGAVLTIDEISAELIADGQHVAAEAMDILIRCKGKNGVHLVTDNTIWAGLPDGTYRDGNRQIIKEGPKAYVKGGTLIGSVAPMNQCVANLVQLVGCSLREASQMASLNAAVLLGIDGRKGSIEKGKDADLVVLEEDFRVHMTMVKGKILHPSEQARIPLQ
jgi:N-acetylglucosamine-6-phosphate deacetylase